jgi:competence protein ComEA
VPEIPPAQLALYAAALIAVVLLGARWLGGGEAVAPAASEAPAIEIREGHGRAVVHVAGEVRRPGVYRLRSGARVVEAVRKAGGPTRRGDLSQLNLAAKIEDGRQVLVPRRTAAPAGATASGPVAAAGTAPAAPVNLNTATVEQLDTLPGIGPSTAAAIVAYRDEHDGFGSVDELDQVPGIGEGRLADLRDAVSV